MEASWRLSAITGNPIFPPLWRLQAKRTLLPEALRRQVRQWKQWIEQVETGEHDEYLRELHLWHTSDFMHYHWSYLHGHAIAALDEDADWAQKAGLAEVREQILRLPEPTVTNARIAPSDESPADRSGFEACYQRGFKDLEALLDLARAWNSLVEGDWRVPDYELDYALTLDAFKKMTRDPWRLDFLRWAEDCAERGFVLYLDY